MEFAHWIRYRVHDGLRVKFWQNEWFGQLVFANQFPNLFLLDHRQQGFVADNFSKDAIQVVWDFSFRRNLIDIEISDFANLLGMLNKMYLSVDKYDVRIWKVVVKGQFSVRFFYKVLDDRNEPMDGWNSFWDPSVPPRVLSFCWVARKHKILMIDKLRKRNHVIVNACPMCLRDEETVQYLLIHC